MIFAFGNCACDEWNEHAQDISDRIVSSLRIRDGIARGFDMYQGVMFDFCPYCGRKLVVAGAGHKSVGMWRGKSLFEYNHQELINIVNQVGDDMRRLRDDFAERIGNMMGDL